MNQGFNISDVADRIWVDEGFVPYVYEDSKGYLTIGPGILVDERRGGGIDEEEGRYLLMRRLMKRLQQLRDRFSWFKRLDPVRQQIIVCMSYQLGVNGVAGFRRMCIALDKGDYIEAAAEMLDSVWAREETPERAKRLAGIMERGEWSNG